MLGSFVVNGFYSTLSSFIATATAHVPSDVLIARMTKVTTASAAILRSSREADQSVTKLLSVLTHSS